MTNSTWNDICFTVGANSEKRSRLSGLMICLFNTDVQHQNGMFLVMNNL